MRLRHWFASMTLVALVIPDVFAQSPSSPVPADGLELLKHVIQHYAQAKSYKVELVEERTSSNDFYRNWQKSILVAAEAPGDRYRYEGRGFEGGALRMSDGKSIWTYHVDDHQYIQETVGGAPTPRPIPMIEGPLMNAEDFRKEYGGLASHLRSARRLDDANLVIDGHEIPCYVIRIESTDMKRQRTDFVFDKTIWIEKTTETFAKIVEHAHTYFARSGGGRTPIDETITTTFSHLEFDTEIPNDFFTFTPPANAKLVSAFPTSFSPDLSGQQAPPLKLKTADGKVVDLESFRGKPVLLDLWATWCAPCVKSLEKIAAIYSEAKDKSIVLVTVDQDEEAQKATDLLAKKSYSWANFHDDGEIMKALGSSGIPRTLLIDKQGKVIYDGNGEERELRTGIAKLGAEYASLAPKPEAPCNVAAVK